MFGRWYLVALASCLTALLAAASTGCVDLNQQEGCTSDDDCRFGRVCNEVIGQCVASESNDGPIEEPAPDEFPDTGPDTSPDATPPMDIYPGPDAAPEPDVIDLPDAPGTDPVDEPDAGEDDTCAVEARARVQPQGGTGWQDDGLQVSALDTVLFDATQSTGDVTRYEWSITERPHGSTQRLLPDNTTATPRLFIDLLGTYRVRLTVYGRSDSGVECQDSDRVEIVAHSGEELHIQLTWDTPNDPDQTDTHGTDLDLHYLHPNGRFGNPPWDIFWRNPTADWGVQGDENDDPRLDIDDIDGAGPENINHNGLEDVTYEVGVYLTNNAEMGTSFATVRIYYYGQLVYERRNRRISQNGDFWHVAQIDGSTGNITEIDELLDGYPFRF